MLSINQTLQGRYKIVRQLGHGGMGAVYEAIDKRFGEPIALKEIIIDSSNEKHAEQVRKAFEREAKSLAKAKHEVVPYVRDYFSEENRQFLVMELVEGQDLGEMLENRKGTFPIHDVVNWMDQLLDALDYLHNLKPSIIHRDIKPQNLKLNARNRIKLLDFGIARSSDKSATVTKQTFVGATLNYSPIEQILRVIDQTFREFIILKHKDKAEAVLKQDTDARCDLYALGGTFYHLLTNHAPVDATKRTLDIWEGKPDPLPNPTELNPEIPVSLANFLLKAMAVERKKRYSSALEMQKSLKEAMDEPKTISFEVKSQTQAETLRMVSREDLKLDSPAEVLLTPLATSPPPNKHTSATEILFIPPASTFPPPAPENEPSAAQTEVFTNPPPSTFSQALHEKTTSKTEILFTPPVSIPPMESPAAETQIAFQPSGNAEPLVAKATETQQNINVARQDVTSVSYLGDMLVDQKQTAPKLPPQTIPKVEESVASNNNLFWLIPIALVGFLGISIIGGLIFFLRPSANASVSNTSSTPVSTATPQQTPPPTDSPTTAPIITAENPPTPTSTAAPKTAPTKQQASQPLAKQPERPSQTDNPEPSQPKPAPTKQVAAKPAPTKTAPKAQDPNCVFTNSCK